MPLFILGKDPVFPPSDRAAADGLLALGGKLDPEWLLTAYRQGIFPWPEGKQVLWWSPDPRFVLFPEELKISRSMRPLLNREAFSFTMDQAFPEVIRQCRTSPRPGQSGTWITPDMEKAYLRMHELGFAHSAEVWQNGELAGGLYGIRLGHVFFGESMFSRVSNASRFAFIRYAQWLKAGGVKLIDCQVYTEYLESLGARMIPRAKFISILEELIR